MKIAIDIRTLAAQRSGVGTYVLHLLDGLSRACPEHEYFLVACRANLEALGHDPGPEGRLYTRLNHENHPWGDLWEHLCLPGQLERRGVQVLHGPATLIPLRRTSFAKVPTIHDLVAFLHRDTVPKKYALYMSWLIGQVVRKADHIISVSQHTKHDLVRVLGLDPSRVSVVHEAPQPAFRPVTDQARLDEALRCYGIERPFFYHVGNIEPRKNLVRLVRAYLSLSSALKGQVQLVVSGQQGWLTRQLHRELGRMELGPDVIFTGYVPQEDLVLLMNAAEAFVFPSLYEGFGLPVLEAMSCATPVITSNISSLPEIVGQAALLVDPLEVDSIAQAMLRVVSDSGLRARLAREGLAQAGKFTWERTALQTMAVYQQAWQERAGR